MMAKIRNCYNQAPHLTQGTVFEKWQNTRNYHVQESQEVSSFCIDDYSSARNRHDRMTMADTNNTKKIHKNTAYYLALIVCCLLFVWFYWPNIWSRLCCCLGLNFQVWQSSLSSFEFCNHICTPLFLAIIFVHICVLQSSLRTFGNHHFYIFEFGNNVYIWLWQSSWCILDMRRCCIVLKYIKYMFLLIYYAM